MVAICFTIFAHARGLGNVDEAQAKVLCLFKQKRLLGAFACTIPIAYNGGLELRKNSLNAFPLIWRTRQDRPN